MAELKDFVTVVARVTVTRDRATQALNEQLHTFAVDLYCGQPPLWVNGEDVHECPLGIASVRIEEIEDEDEDDDPVTTAHDTPQKATQ